MLTVTVSQLNRYIKAIIDEDKRLRDVYVKGEVSGFVRHPGSGHCYFRLGDTDSHIRAVMFRNNAAMLEFTPGDGMAVLARASVGVFERDGAYQIYVTEIIPDGAGAMAVALAQRKARLEALGAFSPENKKPLPKYPMRVGVVTSKAGAAIEDIRTVINRRWPVCTLIQSYAQVQGAGAPEALISALKTLDRAGCDVIILSRGGGSAEDLGAFNDEKLVMTIFNCATPVISAVGHETDFTLCDFAADSRAPTPSAAAELAVPDRAELLNIIKLQKERLRQKADFILKDKENAVNRLKEHPAMRSPEIALTKSRHALDIYEKALYNSKRIFIHAKAEKLGMAAAILDSLSPLRVLDRGYCLARKDGAVAAAKTLGPGDRLELLFADGAAQAGIISVDMGDSR